MQDESTRPIKRLGEKMANQEVKHFIQVAYLEDMVLKKSLFCLVIHAPAIVSTSGPPFLHDSLKTQHPLNKMEMAEAHEIQEQKIKS